MRFATKGWNGMPSWHCYYAAPLAKTYHRVECPRGHDTIPVTYAEAQTRKLVPCKLCKPTPI
jgi:hypothetical protein